MRDALILFISLFIHWSIAPGKQPSCRSVTITERVGGADGEGEGNIPLSFWTTLTARIQFVFWNEKSVSSAGVDLWK